MTVVIGNQRKIMPVCFLRHTISNEMLECRFRVHVNAILNIQTEHVKNLRKSLPVQAYGPLQAKFYNIFMNFQNPRGTNSATMHVKTVGGVHPLFKIYQKTKSNVDTA